MRKLLFVGYLVAILLIARSLLGVVAHAATGPIDELSEFRSLNPNTDLALVQDLAGTLAVEIGDELVDLPLVKTSIDADVKGDLATIVVTQTFRNPTTETLQGEYLYPLIRDAAVYFVKIEGGQPATTGAGVAKPDDLLNEFLDQEVANINPGSLVTMTIKYVQTVPRQGDDHRLVLPLVVGPRYEPLGPGLPAATALLTPDHDNYDVYGEDDEDGDEASFGMPNALAEDGAEEGVYDDSESPWDAAGTPEYPSLPGSPGPDYIARDRLAVRVVIDAGQPIEKLYSKTHHLDTEKVAENKFVVTLAGTGAIDNRDLVLRYRLAGDQPRIGAVAERQAGSGYFSLLIEAPELPKARALETKAGDGRAAHQNKDPDMQDMPAAGRFHDISIDWGDLSPIDVVPRRVPDLNAGTAIRIQGRYDKAGPHLLHVHGSLNGEPISLPLTINFPARSASEDAGAALAYFWTAAQLAEARNYEKSDRAGEPDLGFSHDRRRDFAWLMPLQGSTRASYLFLAVVSTMSLTTLALVAKTSTNAAEAVLGQR